MGSITVANLGTQYILTSESDIASFTGVGTLNVTGTALAPIDVTLSQTANVAAVATINLTYATVHLSGVAGVSLQSNYNIGNGSTLDFTNVASLGVGTAIKFTGTTGTFKISTVYTPTLFTSFAGFGPGKSIDITSSLISRITYTDASGANTGGTLSVYGPNGTVALNTIPLSTGDFVEKNFGLLPDGHGGTIITFDSFANSVTATSASPRVGLNGVVTFTLDMGYPVVVTNTAPTLTLNDGGTALYNAAASNPNKLVFTYTAAPGQNTNALAISGIVANDLTPVGGGSINPLGIVGPLANTIAIDTIAPTISSVTTSPGSGVLAAGQSVVFNVVPSEAVLVAGGTPALFLNDGGTAIYDAASSTVINLVFRHTV